MIRISKNPQIGFDIKAPGLPVVWCGTREGAAELAWSLAERLAPMGRAAAVSAQGMLADSLAELARASQALTAAVECAIVALADRT